MKPSEAAKGSRPAPERRALFGTDGIRGVANMEPMTPETALRLGRAVGHYFRTASDRRHKIVIGKDTRLSGYMLETALASGLCSMGVDPLLVGPMPTPGVAFLTRSLRADAGVAISASHNPFEDNGMKFFGPDGFKLPDDAEATIEELMVGTDIDRMRPTAGGIGRAFRIDDAVGRYNEFLKNVVPRDLTFDGLRIVVDTSHGAAYRIAPTVLGELGADVVAIGNQPDGINITEGCGSLHTDVLCERVLREGADLGIALDGDADRAILVDEQGEIVDGDRLLAILALDLHARGRLRKNTVVATVMSNLGLEVALRDRGISMVRTAVGDRYVVERMRADGLNFGGEQSGHIVNLDSSTTGDGLMTALSTISLLVERRTSLSMLRDCMTVYPQRLVNLRVRDRRELSGVAAVSDAIHSAEAALGDRGRVLVRYSGTELLARVMVEGENAEVVDLHVEAIAEAIRGVIGSDRPPQPAAAPARIEPRERLGS